MTNELVKINENNQVTTDSLTVADRFGKRHCDVLRSIKMLKCSKDYRLRNFALSSYINEQGKEQPYYDMTQDGWMFLVMGFTGERAAEWKEKFIIAFRAMEAKLKELAKLPAQVDMKAIGGLVKKCTAVVVRDELKDVLGKEVKEVIKDQFMDFVMRTFACAEDLKPFQQVTDDMLMRGLYDWYSTRHHAQNKAIEDLTAENDRLKSKMSKIRSVAAE